MSPYEKKHSQRSSGVFCLRQLVIYYLEKDFFQKTLYRTMWDLVQNRKSETDNPSETVDGKHCQTHSYSDLWFNACSISIWPKAIVNSNSEQTTKCLHPHYNNHDTAQVFIAPLPFLPFSIILPLPSFCFITSVSYRQACSQIDGSDSWPALNVCNKAERTKWWKTPGVRDLAGSWETPALESVCASLSQRGRTKQCKRCLVGVCLKKCVKMKQSLCHVWGVYD